MTGSVRKPETETTDYTARWLARNRASERREEETTDYTDYTD